MTRYALLLRGINVGTAHRVRMADLREVLSAEGHGNVATLLQSGNVVLDSAHPAAELGRSVEQALHRRFGFPVPTVVRTREEVDAVLASDPLRAVASDPARHVVVFLGDRAPADLDEHLRGVDAQDDEYAVSGREIYVWCPHGQLHSPLLAALGKYQGGPTGTTRNWRTVTKLAELLHR